MKFRFHLLIALLVSLMFVQPACADDELSSYNEAEVAEEPGEVLDLNTIVHQDINFDQLQAKSYSQQRNQKKTSSYSKNYIEEQNEKTRGSWKPHFEESNTLQGKSGIFFRTDIGLGFLYFSRVRANLMGVPNGLFLPTVVNAPLKQGLMYNRSPLYEYMVGIRHWTYFKGALSYVHQGNVTVSTKLEASAGSNANISSAQLQANLNLDAILVKIYAEAPWPLMWRNMMTNFYLGLGIGPAWQTWSAIQVNYMSTLINYTNNSQPFNLKVCGNFAMMFDAGFRIQRAKPEVPFSVNLGIKFNLWGQARNLGKITQQGSYKYGLVRPFKIKTVYQWAPYLGVQWEFPASYTYSKRYKYYPDVSTMLTQMNVGVGFLYFKFKRGNLVSRPNQNGTGNRGWQSAPVTKDVIYNKTPLFEYLLQHRFNDYLQLGISYQNQSGITVQTEAIPANAAATFEGAYCQLISNLSLNGIMAKGYLRYPILEYHRTVNVAAYLGLGVGLGWQTWSRVNVARVGDILFGGIQPLRQKISANCVVNIDAGAQLTTPDPDKQFSLLAGCKYNYWGQARNIGLQSQQGSSILALHESYKIKKVYQWAPYLGVQWNFPSYQPTSRPYYLGGLSPARWKPYFVPIEDVEKSRGLYTQFNVGVGFLYFSGIRGNLSPAPAGLYTNISRDVPIKGRLSYNRSPLFEYQLGYSFFDWFKAAFSYQHQGNVSLQTKYLNNFQPTVSTFANQKTIFAADLLLDAFMLKAHFEYPKALVWRNTVNTPYFSLAGGPAWQTWKRMAITQPVTNLGVAEYFITTLRDKVCANMAFMFDLGIRTQSPYPNSGFSALFGLRFNVWGQARNLGELQEQVTPRFGLIHPVVIKTVYQWAPYLGVQWNF